MVLISVLVYGIISYLIGEFFGRAKHIGRWWTMFLFWTAPIPIIGLLALIFSPSAKQTHQTKYNTFCIIIGVLFLLLSIKPFINIFNTHNSFRHFGFVFFTAFVTHGIYFILLGTNKIINSNPKFYFNGLNFNNSDSTVKKVNENLNSNTIVEFSNKEANNNNQSALNEKLTKHDFNDDYENLKKLYESGIINLEEFENKKLLIEEKKKTEIAKEKFRNLIEENKKALISLKSLKDSGILTQEEYEQKVTKIKESETIEKETLNLNQNLPSSDDDWKFYLIIIVFFLIWLCFILYKEN
jgi:hypothetical protein